MCQIETKLKNLISPHKEPQHTARSQTRSDVVVGIRRRVVDIDVPQARVRTIVPIRRGPGRTIPSAKDCTSMEKSISRLFNEYLPVSDNSLQNINFR